MPARPTPRSPPPGSAAAAPGPAAPGPRLGARAQLAAALIQALARAARAFTLYDPSNALIGQFIGELRARADAATADGEVAVEVRPFELAADGEVVYRDEDREKSLAFRLYRDGVRRVTFAQGVSFEELVQLLQILAIRFTGIRQAEDDIVTLLRKAELATIEIVAAEGYTSDEGEPERLARALASCRLLAPTFDLPFPRLGAPGSIALVSLPEDALQPLRAEAAPEAVMQGALAIAAELLGFAAQGAIAPGEAVQFCAELRDYQLVDRNLPGLVALADLVERHPAGPLRDEILRGLADPRLLDAVLAAVPPGAREPPPESLRLLPFVPVAAILDLLAAGGAGDRQEPLLALVAARLPADADAVLPRLATVPAAVARALAKAIGARAPARIGEATLALLGHEDVGLQLDALRAAGALPGGVPPAALAAKLLSPSEAVRIAAARALERHGGTATARAVAEALTARRSFSRDEATALGRTLAILHPPTALRHFEAWLPERRGLLDRLKSGEHEELLRWAAAAGLAAMPGPEAERRLEAAAAGSDDELRRYCRAALGRRGTPEGGRRG